MQGAVFFSFFIPSGLCSFIPSALCSFCILDLIMAEVCAWNNFFLHTCMSSVQHEQCRKNLFEAVLGEARATQTLKECNIKFSGYHIPLYCMKPYKMKAPNCALFSVAHAVCYIFPWKI